MRPLWKDILVAVWMGILLPGIVLNAFVLKEKHRENQQSHIRNVQVPRDRDQKILVRDPDGTLRYLSMENYLTGVLLAEMPAEFHPEALKAQSVSARTYTWKAFTTGGKHGDRSVCTDSTCCQGYYSEELYLSNGGSMENLVKVQRAVRCSAPMVMVYQGDLIEATYFSSAAGSTEAAMAVWGVDYPYLQAVYSPEEPSEVTVTYTREEFQECLGIELSGNPEEWFCNMSFTKGGGVDKMEICGVTYSGVQLRSLLGLRSTSFKMQSDDKIITVTTNGYGHRVGMSQYGANTMAESGCTWQIILQHYYPGVTLVPAYNIN